MLIKLIKSLLILGIVALLFLVISIKYPKLLLAGINTLTPYTIGLYTTEHNIANRELTLYDLEITHKHNTYQFDQIVLDFTKLYAPIISIQHAAVHINNLEIFNTSSSFTSFSPRINVRNFQIHYSNEVISGSGSYLHGIVDIDISPISYQSNMLRFFTESEAKTYINNQLEQLTFKHINIIYNTITKEFQSSGTLGDVVIRPHEQWQTIVAPQINYSLTKEGLELAIIEGMMGNLDIAGEKVSIDWHERNSVQVDLAITEKSGEIAQFLQRSPLAPQLEKVLSNIQVNDRVETTASLEFFFDDDIPDNYRIESEFSNAEVIIQDSATFSNTRGMLTITPEIINFKANSEVWNTPLTLHLEYDDHLRIRGQVSGHEIMLTHSRPQEWEVDIAPLSDATEHSIITSSATVDFSSNIPTISIHTLALKSGESGAGDITNLDIHEIPTVRINASNITINDTKLPNFATTITNDGVVALTDTTIENLTTNAATSQFILDTEFTNTHSHALVKIATSNPQPLLTILTIPESFNSSELTLMASISCECPFWQLGLDVLTGKLLLHAKEGMIDKELNAFAKLLSLLSVKSLSKRLELNSGVVSTEQLVFTDISAQGILTNGEIQLEQFDLNSDDIIITMSGSTDLVNTTHNLTANVTPIIKDAVPAVSLLAGSGLVGLGVWLIDKAVFDEQLLNGLTNSLVNFDYAITGTWDNPIIQ